MLCNDWRRLYELAAHNGYTISSEPVGQVLARSRAYLLILTGIDDIMQLSALLTDAFGSSAIACALTPDLRASTLKGMQPMIFEHFFLSPKSFCDAIKATHLLAKMRIYVPASVTKLFWLSGFSCYAVFKAFVHRVFDMTPNQIFLSPDLALRVLEQRLPKVATVLIEHFAWKLSRSEDVHNKRSMFLVFLRKKSTYKSNIKNS